MGEEAVRKIREKEVDLKARLGPLRAELQRLEVQRVCLEQRLTQMESEREGSVTEYEVHKLKVCLKGVIKPDSYHFLP